MKTTVQKTAYVLGVVGLVILLKGTPAVAAGGCSDGGSCCWSCDICDQQYPNNSNANFACCLNIQDYAEERCKGDMPTGSCTFPSVCAGY